MLALLRRQLPLASLRCCLCSARLMHSSNGHASRVILKFLSTRLRFSILSHLRIMATDFRAPSRLPMPFTRCITSGASESELKSSGITDSANPPGLGNTFSDSNPEFVTVQTHVGNVRVPVRRSRDPLAVLHALARTVGPDPTAPAYQYIDDPGTTPHSLHQSQAYIGALSSGQKAAKWISQRYPAYMNYSRAEEPHIRAFLTPNPNPLLEEDSEEALRERIKLRLVTSSIDMYDRLAKEEVNTLGEDTLLEFLELLCATNSFDIPAKDTHPTHIDRWALSVVPYSGEDVQTTSKSRGRSSKWQTGGLAHSVFERLVQDAEGSDHWRAYECMICGLLRYNELQQAYDLFRQMVEKRVQISLEVYNGILESLPTLFDTFDESWNAAEELLEHMADATRVRMKSEAGDLTQGPDLVAPSRRTFHALLSILSQKAIRGKAATARVYAVFSEMLACGIEPSLGTYWLLFSQSPKEHTLHRIMEEIDGKRFDLLTKEDVNFFVDAMQCAQLNHSDVELGKSIHRLLHTPGNYRLLGHQQKSRAYHMSYLLLVLETEILSKAVEVFHELVPNLITPSHTALMTLLAKIQGEEAYDHLAGLWHAMSFALAGRTYYKEQAFYWRLLATAAAHYSSRISEKPVQSDGREGSTGAVENEKSPAEAQLALLEKVARERFDMYLTSEANALVAKRKRAKSDPQASGEAELVLWDAEFLRNMVLVLGSVTRVFVRAGKLQAAAEALEFTYKYAREADAIHAKLGLVLKEFKEHAEAAGREELVENIEKKVTDPSQ